MSLTVSVRRALVFGCLATSSPVLAAPDFSKSEVTVDARTVDEAGVATFTVIVRNAGPDDAGAMTATTYWPVDAFLVDASGTQLGTFDYPTRAMLMTFALAAGAERRFTVRVLAPRDSAGSELTLEVRVADLASRAEHRFRQTATVTPRPSRSGLRIWSVRIPPVAFVLAGLVAGGVLLRVIVLRLSARAPRRRRRGRRPSFAFIGPSVACTAVTVAVAFWTMFGAMAWRDYQSVTTWPQTTCRILGGRMSALAVSPSGGSAPAAPRSDASFVPVLGLEYLVGGRLVHSTGYDTGSQVTFAGAAIRRVELEEWFVGARIPCWYNPRDPADVVVRSGFGGIYVFALFPAPLFVIGVMRIRSFVTGRG